MGPLVNSLSVASLFCSLGLAMPGAMPWTGPMATPMGLMATAGISPRPTQAPTPDFLPGDLRQRQNVIFPPPLNWCGFANSLYDDPLSCSVGLTCVNSGAAMGCCTATTGICDALYTTCANYLDVCDAACQANPAVRKCGAAYPFCGTYDFNGGTQLYNCQPTSMNPVAVEFLNDYYITAIGSTLGGASTAVLANSGLVSLGPAAASSTGSTTATGGSTGSGSTTSYTSTGLSPIAIDGIAAGCSVGGALIFGLIVFFCLRRRRHNRIKRATQEMSNSAYAPFTPMPPMQQQQQQQPPLPQMQMQLPIKAFDGYQSVPQQEQFQQYQQYPSPPAEQKQQQFYPIPPADQQQQQQQQRPPSYFQAPGPAAGSVYSGVDSREGAGVPPLSSASPSNANQSYYQPPHAPDVGEVDGTMGNPGVPSSTSTHALPNEVDATMGNPSVPLGGHGIPLQGIPGGTPSSTEIDGQPMRASMTAPFTEVYEMPQDRS